MFDDIVNALQLMVETSLSEINTSTPGVVVSYDAAKNRAIVKPTLPKRIDSGDKLDPPQIVEVPIVWPASGGGNASLTFPLKPGDGVMLSFQQRSLEGWLSGKNGIPDDPRQFDLSDCVAIPGCAPGGIVAHSDDVVLKSDQCEVRLTKDNTIHIGNANGGITIDKDGNMTLNAQTIQINTPARNFVLEQHHHTNVQSGLANSGPPA